MVRRLVNEVGEEAGEVPVTGGARGQQEGLQYSEEVALRKV